MLRLVIICALSFVTIVFGVAPDRATCAHKLCLNVREGTNFNNPRSCASYFKCSGGRAKEMECPNGLWFDSYNKICRHHSACDAYDIKIANLKCVDEEGVDNYWPIRCPKVGETSIPNPINCSEYFLCLDGIPTLMKCAPTLEFDAIWQKCMTKEQATCSQPRCPPTNIPPTLLPIDNNCSKYAICLNGKEILKDCTPGLHWSVKDKWCTFPEIANCKLDKSDDAVSKTDLTTEKFKQYLPF